MNIAARMVMRKISPHCHELVRNATPMCQWAKGTFDATVSSGPDGTLMLVESAASDRVEENLNPIGRIYYTGSTWLCCAHAISEEGTHVLGAQAGTARLAQVCREAGFSRIRKATETPFNLILEARP